MRAFVLMLVLGLQVSSAQTPAPNASHVQPHGAHGIRNEQFGLFLRPRDASNKDGEPIVLYPFQPWKCMPWHFDEAPGGTRLVNFFTGKSFEMKGNALVQMPSTADHQKQESLHFVPVEKDVYEIVGESGDALTAVDSDGHGDIRVVVSPWKNAPAQRWRLVDIPDHFTM